MVYLVIFILLIIGIFKYDFNNKGMFGSNILGYYYVLVAFLILISGLAYRMGDDGIVYELEYKQYKSIWDIDLRYLTSFPGRQPGWVLLSTLCKTLSDSYWLFKLVHALIVNLVVAIYIKRLTKYIFTGLLFYSILLFFDFNFGALRQSVAVAFFLISLNFYQKRKWTYYYLISIVAFLFHDSSVILFLLPILRYLDLGNKYTLLFFVLLGGIIYYASDILNMILVFSSEQELFDRMDFYADRIDADNISISLLNLVLNAVVPVFAYKRLKTKQNILFPEFVFVYIFFYVLSMFTPIVYRLYLFFGLFYILLWLEFIVYIAKRICKAQFTLALVCLIMAVIFCGFRKRLWFDNLNGIPRYAYIYPYSSVITEEKYPQRETLFLFGNLGR